METFSDIVCSLIRGLRLVYAQRQVISRRITTDELKILNQTYQHIHKKKQIQLINNLIKYTLLQRFSVLSSQVLQHQVCSLLEF